jgi:hypothetical protein
MTGDRVFTQPSLSRTFMEAQYDSSRKLFYECAPRERRPMNGRVFKLFEECWSFDPNKRPFMKQVAERCRGLRATEVA